MTRSVVLGISSNARDELGLAAARLVRHRHRRPHALIKLTTELLHEALGILGDIWIALGDQLLTMPRAHAQELHRRDYGRGPVAARPLARWARGRSVRPKTSTGPAPAPRPRSPSRTASLAISLGRARGVERRVAQGEVRRQRRRVRAARPVGRAVRVPLAGDPLEHVAVEEHVGRRLAVAAGDHHRRRPERVQTPREVLDVVGRSPRAPPSRRARRASGTFGVITVTRGRSSRTIAARAGSSSSTAPDSATITGSSTIGVPGASSSSASPTACDRLGGTEHPDLHRVDADVLGHRPDLGDDEVPRHRVDRGHRRRCSAPSAPRSRSSRARHSARTPSGLPGCRRRRRSPIRRSTGPLGSAARSRSSG